MAPSSSNSTVAADSELLAKNEGAGFNSTVEQLNSTQSALELLSTYRQLEAKYQRRTLALASAAHELKTPLAVCTGYADLLLTEKLGPLNQAQREVLTEVQLSCSRLQRFIEDFLNYSALETGNLSLKPEMADPKVCLGQVCDIWLPRFQQKGLAFYALISEKLSSFAFDFYKVQHVLSNLLHNALKFTTAGGTVWLAAEPHLWERRSESGSFAGLNRRIQTLSVANSMRVTVSDTGVGISPEFQQEVFDEFCSASRSDAANYGTGLGLSIARRFVLAHGGKIWLESKVGSGSKFSFLLPFSQWSAGENENNEGRR